MSDQATQSPFHATWDMQEERYSLAELRHEVAQERLSGAPSLQKLKQDEIQRLFDNTRKQGTTDEGQG